MQLVRLKLGAVSLPDCAVRCACWVPEPVPEPLFRQCRTDDNIWLLRLFRKGGSEDQAVRGGVVQQPPKLPSAMLTAPKT